MFEKGDYVFYASGGICRIEEIAQAPLAGMPADRTYYVLRSLHDANGISYLPTDCTTVFLRPILTANQADQLLQNADKMDLITAPDAKALRARYQEAMRTYQPNEWLRVLKTIQDRAEQMAAAARTQRISETERSFGEEARKYLYTELSLALDLPDSQIEAFIFKGKKAE